MTPKPGQIGTLAEEVLDHVRTQTVVKLAEYEAAKNASLRPDPKTELGQVMLKMADVLRSKSEDVSVHDVQNFVEGLSHAK